jgi:hypothetical protein
MTHIQSNPFEIFSQLKVTKKSLYYKKGSITAKEEILNIFYIV